MAVVVDDAHLRTAGGGPFAQIVEATADPGEAFQCARARIRRHAQLPAHCCRGQCVQHVVPARQRPPHFLAGALRQAQGEAHARPFLHHVLGAHVGLRAHAVAHHVARGLGGQRGHFRIIDAQHRQAIERQALQELGEGRLHAGEIVAVVLQMIGINVGDDRHQRIQAQEAAIAFVGLGHQPLATTQLGVGTGGQQLATDHEGRVQAAFAQHRSGQAGGGGLAVGTGHGDAAAEAHQLGQHRRARHDRNALAARFHQFRVVLADRAGHHHAVGAQHIGRRVAAHDARPQAGQAAGRAVVGIVRAGDFVAQRQHHFGDTAHAGAADADEMHAREGAHQVVGVVQATDHARPRAGQARWHAFFIQLPQE
ncbi:hypothetical protein G6F59_013101 [Rhizopus arrhizus]|nr:hypothetical protein G6F59_013101 [Rhizopus arrhizus]